MKGVNFMQKKTLINLVLLLGCFVFLAGFVELKDISVITFEDKADADFISYLKPAATDYSKAAWDYMNLVNSLAQKDKDGILNIKDTVKPAFIKMSKALESAPAANNKDLTAFKTILSESVKIGIDSLNKIEFPKSSKQNKTQKLDNKKIEEIKSSTTAFQSKFNALPGDFKRYFNLMTPMILFDEEQCAYQKAEKSFCDGEFDQGLKTLDEILKKNNDNFSAHKLKGVILSKNKDYKNSEKSFLEALRLNLKDPEVFFEIGKILEMQNKPADAVNSYEVAIKLYPEYTDALYYCGNLMLKNNIRTDVAKERLTNFILYAEKYNPKKYDEMIKTAKELISAKPKNEKK